MNVHMKIQDLIHSEEKKIKTEMPELYFIQNKKSSKEDFYYISLSTFITFPTA